MCGLSVVGRRDWGIYPIRGKFINCRDMTPNAVVENKEARELLQILGLQIGATYDAAAVRKLPYSRLMVMSDMDADGSHIAGLLSSPGSIGNACGMCLGARLR